VREVWVTNLELVKSPTRCQRLATVATLIVLALAQSREYGHRSLVTPERVLSKYNKNLIFLYNLFFEQTNYCPKVNVKMKSKKLFLYKLCKIQDTTEELRIKNDSVTNFVYELLVFKVLIKQIRNRKTGDNMQLQKFNWLIQ